MSVTSPSLHAREWSLDTLRALHEHEIGARVTRGQAAVRRYLEPTLAEAGRQLHNTDGTKSQTLEVPRLRRTLPALNPNWTRMWLRHIQTDDLMASRPFESAKTELHKAGRATSPLANPGVQTVRNSAGTQVLKPESKK